MASRTYSVYSADLPVGGVPHGAAGPVDAIQTAEDGRYLELPNVPPADPSGMVRAGWSYDSAFPPATTIDAMTFSVVYAQTVPTACFLSSEAAFGFATLGVPAVLVSLGQQPGTANWASTTVRFDESTSGVFPYANVGTWTDALGLYTFDTSIFFVYNPPGSAFIDSLQLVVEATLPLPTIPSGPSFFSTTRNSTELSGLLSAAAGISNGTYHLTVRTRYTQSDPASAGSQDEDIGQGQIFETAPQTVFNDDATARNISILDSITGLSPNTTYYAQLRCENADGDIVDSPWTSFTTRQFDTVLSF